MYKCTAPDTTMECKIHREILFGRYLRDITTLEETKRVMMKKLHNGKQLGIKGEMGIVNHAVTKVEEVLDRLQGCLECKMFSMDTGFVPFFLYSRML